MPDYVVGTTVKKSAFQHRYKQLLFRTVEESYGKNYPSTEISFQTGLWYEEEGYKRNVWKNARKKLATETWTEHRDDPDYIISCVNQAVFACDNLLSEENRTFRVPDKLIRSAHAAEIFYNLFHSNSDLDDEKAFKALVPIFQGIYDAFSVVAYFFFLKDINKYAPVRRDMDARCLSLLIGSGSCMTKCTWENYMIYMHTVYDLKWYLQEELDDVELIDAQSFLWMMYKIKPNTPEPEMQETETFETTIIRKYSEGRRIEYYGTKYERDPRVRAACLSSKKSPYVCEACGFDFEKVYGSLGEHFIEVHHKKPLSVNNEEVVETDPSKDMACLCANCHRMIHRKKNTILAVEELKSIIDNRRRAESQE